jgi:hypothetical protein
VTEDVTGVNAGKFFLSFVILCSHKPITQDTECP